MKLSGLSESVTVTAVSPTIDVKANAVTATVDANMIALIPKGRGLLSVLTQIPGTNNETRGGGLMIDGASGSENRFLVDGVDRTNARTGTATAITGTEVVVQDFIEEVQVKQSGWTAEYRAALGGVVNAVTKSGSNEFHGSAGAYYTTNDWLGDIRQTVRARAHQRRGQASPSRLPRDNSHQTDMVRDPGRPDQEGQDLVLRRLRSTVLPVGADGDLDEPRHLSGDADVRQRRPEQPRPQLQRHLAAVQLRRGRASPATTRRRRAPSRSRPSSPTARARRARPRSTRAPRCSPSSSQNCLQRHPRLGVDREDLRQRDGRLPGLRPAQRRRRLLPRHAPHVHAPPTSDRPACRPSSSSPRLRRQQLELVHGGGRLPSLQLVG